MGLSLSRRVCPVKGGSVLSGSDLSKVGSSCPKWVCIVPIGNVLSKVGLFCPKWICPLPARAGLSCPK